MGQIAWLLIALIGFILSLWILIPAPTSRLIPLSVGVPEISHWLMIIQGSSLMMGLITFEPRKFFYILITINLIGFTLSCWPWLQFSQVNRRWHQEIEAKLGSNYLDSIPELNRAKMRSRPLIIPDLFTGISLPEVRVKRGITFAQLDGINLTLNVYQPLSVGKYPGLVVIYGGAWQNGSPHNQESFSRYMANQGYTIIAIDYRHAPQYKFPVQVNDVHLALQYIRDNALELQVDLNKMAIMGRSAGGQLALLSGYQNDWLNFQAVIAYYSPINLAHAYRHLPVPDPINIRKVLERYLGGNPNDLPDLYQQASPINYVQANLPPTLLIYCPRDHIVRANAGATMARKLTESSNCAIFLEIDWADHAFDTIFSGLSNQLALYYTERFLASILKSKH